MRELSHKDINKVSGGYQLQTQTPYYDNPMREYLDDHRGGAWDNPFNDYLISAESPSGSSASSCADRVLAAGGIGAVLFGIAGGLAAAVGFLFGGAFGARSAACRPGTVGDPTDVGSGGFHTRG